MKKKIFLVLGLIVFAILAAGSVGGNTEAGKGNVNVAGCCASGRPPNRAFIRFANSNVVSIGLSFLASTIAFAI